MEEKPRIQIPRVKLGSQGLEVSRLGFGCGGLSGIYNAPLSHEDGCSVIKEAFNMGITFFDTSDLYGHNHDNEIMVGKAKNLPREKIQLATKFGVTMSEDFQFGVKGTPEHVRKSCEASLKRLNVDYIDLYYQHRVDISVPIEDTMGELKKLVEEGKIKYIGLSEPSVNTIRRAHAVHPITALEMDPLGRGFLGGKAVLESLPTESLLSMHPRFTGENLEKNKLLYSKLSKLADKHGCTTPQLALAWLLHQGNDIIPIPGTTKVKNLANNIGSLAVKLSEEDLKEICDAMPIHEVGGDRDYESLTIYSWKFADTPLK
ncbi:Perakine reductase [Morus notabilis]|uniref:Perakine reductase n=1 Tax=Morus notabilis TaxID=981085 RepID=W9SM31_9ROSA|nr:Perakine reductase [Morus notabilis]